MRREKALKILGIFETLYPNPGSELNFSNQYQLIVAVVLSAQCTDKKVNQVTAVLFKKYPDFNSLASARLEDVSTIIQPVNYYKTKSRNIISLAKIISEQYQSELPLAHTALTQLPGVGNKTANVVLGELNVIPTLPVDTHVFRVSKRLGMADGKNVKIVEDQLRKLLPPSTWRSAHHLLIPHGRRLCKAANPNCNICPVSKLCQHPTK